jgi:hypothetical protein
MDGDIGEATILDANIYKEVSSSYLTQYLVAE